MRILVTTASKHGSTGEIAERIGATLRAEGLDVTVAPVEQAGPLDGFDAVVVGSAIYAGHWLAAAREWIEEHREALGALPVWMFSSGPLGEDELKPAGEPAGVVALREQVTPRAHAVFAGKLDKTTLGFAERAVARAVRAPFGDFRDWEAIDAWAREIAEELAPAPVG